MSATRGPASGALRRSGDPLRRVLPLLEVRPGKVAAAIALGTLALVCAIGLAAAAAWLVARASQMPPVLTLSVAVVSVRAFGIGRGVLRYCERLASHDVALRGMAALRANVYEALARSSAPLTVRRGDLLARLGADVDDVGDVVVRALVPAGVALVVGLASVVLIGAFLPAAGATLAACLLLAGVAAPWLAARAAATVEVQGAAARGEVTALTLELLEDAAPLRVAGRFDDRLAALARADDRLTSVADAGARTTGLSALIGALAQGLAVVAAIALGVPAVLEGRLTPEELTVVVLTPLAVFEATAGLPAAAVQLHRSRAAAGRLLSLLGAGGSDVIGSSSHDRQLELPIMRRTTDHARPDDGEPDHGAPLLQLTDVTAGWGDRVVVAGISLTLGPGSVVALAGPSGVGKTTLLATAAGLIPPVSGTVASPSALLVAEDGHVFDTTVLENLRVARGEVTPDEAREALLAVGLGGWLDALPDGLGTVLGSDAAAISGGERRRLLVARALLAPARVLLVDEPAEHLDAATADALVRTLAEHARSTGRAVLVATHRLTPLADVDEVLVLGPGEPATVRARGTHEELLHDEAYAWSAAQEGASSRTE
ncbi:thiol reductant ABC exporter subunit CydC [Antribacter gilvus]|uniref:thiol reductant ABC exporter subunit CydC n=1 Tax=Antribacter gilvus TaxID=2304675 RepID=UPI000F7B072E|nr:thiol reductant ABC exporter subunit CydC [Antribacter gilvus]